MAEIDHVLTSEGGGTTPPLDLVPVKLRKTFNPAQVDDALANIRHALTLDLPQFGPANMGRPRPGAMILVGGGPSMVDSLPDIKRLAKRRNSVVVAFNDALPFLLGNGVRVWATVFMEVEPWRPEFMRQVPDGVIYFMASQCHPETYEKMSGSQIVQWHADEGIAGVNDLIYERFGSEVPMIPGGVTALTRTLFLGHAMGYRRFEVFGADSSHGDSSHAYYDRDGQMVNDIFMGGKWWKAPGYLARQCEDLVSIIRCHHPVNMRIRVHGSGMFPHAAMILGVHAKYKAPKGAH